MQRRKIWNSTQKKPQQKKEQKMKEVCEQRRKKN